MNTALISDIHGNATALTAVLADARRHGIDRYVFVGDYIFDLPFSNKVVRRLMDMDNACIIKGNKEGYLTGFSQTDRRGWVHKQINGMYQTVRELPDELTAYLLSLNDELYLPLDKGGTLYAAHYLKDFKREGKHSCSSSRFHKRMLAEPFTHEQFLTDFQCELTQDDMKKVVGGIDASVIVFGHDHLQRYGTCDGKLLINPGSCGLPLDFDPRAAYTILETTPGGYTVIERRVEYDIEETIRCAKASALYAESVIWSELVYRALRTGRDYFGLFFETAGGIAASKGERGEYFSNETWAEAGIIDREIYGYDEKRKSTL